MLRGLPGDVRDAFRALTRHRATTAVAILTLALGVGANAAVFSVFESVLVNPLPYRHAAQLFHPTYADARGERNIEGWLAAEWMRRCPAIATVALYADSQKVLTGDGDAEVFRGQRVNAGFFDTLGVAPLLGRVFTPEEDRAGAGVVVLSHELWTSRFGADPLVVGRTYTLNGAPARVIGVLGADFQPLRMSNAAEMPRIYSPIGFDPAIGPDACRGDCASARVIVRLADGASIARAHAELAGAMRDLHAEHPADVATDATIHLDALRQHLTAPLRQALWIALAAAACVLAIACANLANLQLARAHARAGEFAVRGALGAGTGRVARLMLLESALTAAVGCAAGVGLGRLAIDLLIALAPRELPRLAEIGLDGRVLLTAIAIGLATALAAGVAPAWMAARVDLNDALKRHADNRAGHARGRAALVIAQVGLAFVLVTAAGLLIRSVRGLLTVDAGFDATHVLTMTPVIGSGAASADGMLAKKRRMIDAIEALPGVVAAGMVNEVPLSHVRPFQCEVEGAATPGVEPPPAHVFWIEGSYLTALRVRLREGRWLTQHDGPDAPAALVSETFVRHRFPDGRALGRRIRLPDGPWLTIVGVVGDVRNVALDERPDEAVYQPLALNPGHYMRIVARASGDPSALERPIRAVVRAIDPLVPIFHVQPMEDYLASSMAQRRFALALMAAFGVLALALACIGLYGLLSYTVVLRVPELGVRAALGASAADLLRLILSGGMTIVAAGLAAGVALALAGTRVLASLLYGIGAVDAPTFAAAAAVIGASALAACLVPARRAARVDPLTTIRGHS
jgi:putative ABC transport system permease protein